MNLIFPDACLVALLQRIANGDFHFHLFGNNHTPSPTTVLGDLTELGSGTGYAIQTVAAADFTLTGVTAHVGSITAADISFGPWSSGADVAYGYYITDTTNTILLAVARFDGAPLPAGTGNVIVVTPKLGDFSQYTA